VTVKLLPAGGGWFFIHGYFERSILTWKLQLNHQVLRNPLAGLAKVKNFEQPIRLPFIFNFHYSCQWLAHLFGAQLRFLGLMGFLLDGGYITRVVIIRLMHRAKNYKPFLSFSFEM
jgi:hypothetical protein